jgi:DNA repair protein RadA/Sms
VRRVALGVDGRRLVLLLAVMARRAGLQLAELDVFVAAAGGLAVREPAADLALALALVSALSNVPVPADLVAFGEVGLTGEVRRVPGIERRLAEAARHGFCRALVPPGRYEAPRALEVVTVANLRAACAHLAGLRAPAGEDGVVRAPVLPLIGGSPT